MLWRSGLPAERPGEVEAPEPGYLPGRLVHAVDGWSTVLRVRHQIAVHVRIAGVAHAVAVQVLLQRVRHIRAVVIAPRQLAAGARRVPRHAVAAPVVRDLVAVAVELQLERSYVGHGDGVPVTVERAQVRVEVPGRLERVRAYIDPGRAGLQAIVPGQWVLKLGRQLDVPRRERGIGDAAEVGGEVVDQIVVGEGHDPGGAQARADAACEVGIQAKLSLMMLFSTVAKLPIGLVQPDPTCGRGGVFHDGVVPTSTLP